MNRIAKCVTSVLLLSVLTCTGAWAQATAQITGTVKDPTGAVLPGVEITATQTDTGIARMTITNETGTYILSNLPLGPYKLEASLAGFRTFVQSGIVLQVNSNPVINVTLEVGQVSEQVEVQANAALVETRPRRWTGHGAAANSRTAFERTQCERPGRDDWRGCRSSGRRLVPPKHARARRHFPLLVGCRAV